MAQIVGKYVHVKSENLDDYFKTVGVPYIARKMMGASNPTMEITKSEDEKWTITISTVFRTVVYSFKLGEDYEETMPGAVLKCNTTLDGNIMTTKCISPDKSETTRTYVFNDDGLTLNYKHHNSQKEAVRYYKRQ
ncbi:unnamed protein product [Ceutorhynchus assimilis]|uniref:Lipocalin/cytosolic fatty-acid binding domain-containing protein n=1 Tax=Ceutorhynchus assimilis TaxID=467358 RepID=A0A9N9MEG6_9CUCU|nr:unnamed protein product [Ceutorhynchus assimilis]